MRNKDWWILIDCLDDSNFDIVAVMALRAIGPAAKAAIARLIRLADKDEPYLQRQAILALCRIGKGHPEGIRRLVEWCETENFGILHSIEPADLGDADIRPLLNRAAACRHEYLEEHALELIRAIEKRIQSAESSLFETSPTYPGCG
jgi:HEAT repeat protein